MSGNYGKGAAQVVCEDSVKAQLKDPESAQVEFTTFTEGSEGEWTVIGTVNARNSFGGYVGAHPFRCTTTKDGDGLRGIARVSRS